MTGKYSLHSIFRGISEVGFDDELFPHLIHSNPCLVPLDFIFLLQSLHVGLLTWMSFANSITSKNSTLTILS